MDCSTIQSEPSAVERLKAECARRQGAPTLRIEPDEAPGTWTVTELDGLALGDSGTRSSKWQQSTVDGMACVSAPFVAICKVPINKAVFRQLAGEDVRSQTGLLLVGQGLMADVIKVNK